MNRFILGIVAVLIMLSSSIVMAESAKEMSYLYSREGDIIGWETKDYVYKVDGEIMGYKVRDDKYVYIYSPDGERLGYKKRVQAADYQYLYDSDGRIMGYFGGPGKASPFLKSEDPLKTYQKIH